MESTKARVWKLRDVEKFGREMLRNLRHDQKQEKARLLREQTEERKEFPVALEEYQIEIARLVLHGLIDDENIGFFRSRYSAGCRDGYYKVKVGIPREDLPQWRKAGKLSVVGREFYKTDDDGKNWIRVYCSIEGFKRLQIVYVRELPASARCQIKEQVSTYKSLVCDLVGSETA